MGGWWVVLSVVLRTRLGLGRHAIDWLLAAGRGSTKLGLGAGTSNNTTPPLARPSVPFFRGPKLPLQSIDSYHDFLPPSHRVCPLFRRVASVCCRQAAGAWLDKSKAGSAALVWGRWI
ncbi:hypothetical protein Naga_101508g2 [Nannochloropsis gaditana]|uniref:Secreted protein n=1 Tax=Nannochloropsis gaditana TaxID=72520 RepID=W7T095_9STRA|nr:hypothetical protein Naga_101508g2 [Nannochloropsis gaditana]